MPVREQVLEATRVRFKKSFADDKLILCGNNRLKLRISLHTKKQKQTKMRFSFSTSVLFISIIGLPMESSVEGQFQQSASILQGKEKQLFKNPWPRAHIVEQP